MIGDEKVKQYKTQFDPYSFNVLDGAARNNKEQRQNFTKIRDQLINDALARRRLEQQINEIKEQRTAQMKQMDARIKTLQNSTLYNLNQLFDGPIYGVDPNEIANRDIGISPPLEYDSIEDSNENYANEDDEDENDINNSHGTQGLFVNRNIQIAPHFKEYSVEKRKILM